MPPHAVWFLNDVPPVIGTFIHASQARHVKIPVSLPPSSSDFGNINETGISTRLDSSAMALDTNTYGWLGSPLSSDCPENTDHLVYILDLSCTACSGVTASGGARARNVATPLRCRLDFMMQSLLRRCV